MCLGIPGEVIEILADQPDLARVDVSGVKRNINIGLLEEAPEPGDWILIHVGFALSRIDEVEAKAALDFLESIGQAYQDEIAALMESTIGLDENAEDNPVTTDGGAAVRAKYESENV